MSMRRQICPSRFVAIYVFGATWPRRSVPTEVEVLVVRPPMLIISSGRDSAAGKPAAAKSVQGCRDDRAPEVRMKQQALSALLQPIIAAVIDCMRRLARQARGRHSRCRQLSLRC